jgi:hypothetical protein
MVKTAMLLMLFVPATAAAQTATRFAGAFDVVSLDLAESAALMPADKYGYRPTPEVRSFGQIVAHVTGGQFLYCSQATGTKPPPDVFARLGAMRPFSDVATESKGRAYQKDELVAFLAESIAFCKTAYTAAGASARVLVDNIAHSSEHYGNLVIYLRQNGIVPPSTARAGK